MPKITIDELSTEELEALESYYFDLVRDLRIQTRNGIAKGQLAPAIRRQNRIEEALEIARRDDADSIHDSAMELKEDA